MSSGMTKVYREELYIALENYNFDWRLKDVLLFDLYWLQGRTIQEIAELMRRAEIEVLLLYLDRVDKAGIPADTKRVMPN